MIGAIFWAIGSLIFLTDDGTVEIPEFQLQEMDQQIKSAIDRTNCMTKIAISESVILPIKNEDFDLPQRQYLEFGIQSSVNGTVRALSQSIGYCRFPGFFSYISVPMNQSKWVVSAIADNRFLHLSDEVAKNMLRLVPQKRKKGHMPEEISF